MFCSKCGFQNNPGAIVCGQCGAVLDNNQQNVNTNTQNTNNGTYRLTLTRPKDFVGALIKFNIFSIVCSRESLSSFCEASKTSNITRI